MRIGVSFLRPLLVPMSVVAVAKVVAVVVAVSKVAAVAVVVNFFLLAVALDFCIVKKRFI